MKKTNKTTHDMAMTEVNVLLGCVKYALSNPDCSLAWAFDCDPSEVDEEWMTNELLDIEAKLKKIDAEHIITIECDNN